VKYIILMVGIVIKLFFPFNKTQKIIIIILYEWCVGFDGFTESGAPDFSMYLNN